MLIEDVACPVDKLGDMTQDLVDMFQKYGYKDASCFGHALEGNLHLVFSQVGCTTSHNKLFKPKPHSKVLKPATSVVQWQVLVCKHPCLCQAAAVSSGKACKRSRVQASDLGGAMQSLYLDRSLCVCGRDSAVLKRCSGLVT